MKQKLTIIFAIALSLIAGCAKPSPQPPSAVVYQNSTIDALLDGNYDGEVTFAEVARHGDVGLGTLNALDGEMVALDGRFYQIRSDGHAYDVPADAQTPLAVVTFFHNDASRSLTGPLNYRGLQQQLDAMRTGDGHAVAFIVHGKFKTLRTRSVPRQSKPYPRLAEVVKTQPTFEFENVSGDLVGFWFPESMRHVNVPGYHFHFLTSDKSAGGHVLDLEFTSGEVSCEALSSIELALPSRAPTSQPASNSSDELNRVEK